MAWVCVSAYGLEEIYEEKPIREVYDQSRYWRCDKDNNCISLPEGSIKKLIGRDMSWEDEPVELKDE